MVRFLLLVGVAVLLPASARAYINAGFRSAEAYRRYLEREKLVEIARATEAIQRDPKDPVAYYHRGRIYFRQLNFEQALYDFNKAVEFDSRFAKAYYRRGRAFLALD